MKSQTNGEVRSFRFMGLSNLETHFKLRHTFLSIYGAEAMVLVEVKVPSSRLAPEKAMFWIRTIASTIDEKR